MKVNITPRWMSITLIICRWFMHTVPFVCCSIALFFTEGMSLGNNYVLTAVYALSVIKLWDLVD